MTSEGFVIRQARPDDVDTIVMFNAAMALETERRRLNLEMLRQGTLAFLENSRYGFYVVAEHQEGNAHEPVGQLMITYEWSDWRNGVFWWIQSVYVLPGRRRMGVFRAMYDHIVVKAKAESRVCGIRLYVERENLKAQTVYQRVGLNPSIYTLFEQDFVFGMRTSENNEELQ